KQKWRQALPSPFSIHYGTKRNRREKGGAIRLFFVFGLNDRVFLISFDKFDEFAVLILEHKDDSYCLA
ncbi:MAG: hypothetical protein IKH37_09575, partial [Prevotella sp.]|nr:hypothetical protein [Prevotella sp.]